MAGWRAGAWVLREGGAYINRDK
ncbi:hypothetical protein E2C01_090832 [Portunus trituberculatus]|uniref:Uncharacterized protein n=1 Tax=Portunus trituberculatus TaxID=210409 RepID=A0A5B7JTG7_PORTR|nr:hypothetical protein [Portunus trituberculatus]